MKERDRQKICSHCEGRIAVESDTCLYCGMPLLEGKFPEKGDLQDSLDSLYPPPYSNRNTADMKIDKEYTSPFKTAQKDTTFGGLALPSEASTLTEKKDKGDGGLAFVLMALLGSNLLILGIMQCFFSEEGFLRLEWSSQYWFILCLISLPLLYFGMKKREE